MDMNLIALKVDPGQAATTLDQFTTKLRGTETQSQQTQAAFEKLNGAFKSMAQAIQQEQTALARIPLNNLAQGFGQLGEMMARVQAVSDRLARANDPLAQGFARVAQQLQREQDVLMAIRQPQMEYFDTLTALDKLLERNAISTQEYAQQVTKLNQSIEQTPKQQGGHGGGDILGQVAGGIGGTAGSVLGAAAGGGVVAGAMAGVSAIGDLLQEHRKLEDEYTNLINHEMKFTDATHSLSSVMSQQRDIAGALHATLKDTADVYDAVQDATADLNLSSRDLATLTKAVGQEAIISGKSMSSAGDVLNRMILAMDSGVGAGRALKGALVGYDAISDTLTQHFHTTRAGLIALVDAHKIGSRDIVDALKSEADQTQKNYDQRKVTNEQQIAMITEEANTLRQQGVPGIAAYALAGSNGLKEVKEAWLNTNDALKGNSHEMDTALANIEQLTKDLENQTGAFAEVGKAEAKAFGGMLDDLSAAQGAFTLLGHTISTALGQDAWAGLDDKTGLLKFLPLGTKTAMEFAAATAKNKEAITDLNAAYVAGAFGDLSNPKSAARATEIFLAKLEQLTEGLKKQTDVLKEHHEAVQQESEGLLALQRDLNPKFNGMESMLKDSDQAMHDLLEFSKQLTEEQKRQADEQTRAQQEATKARQEQLTKEWHAQIEQADKAIEAMKNDAKTALDPLKQAFSDLILKGKADWGAMLDQMASNGLSKLLDKGESSLLDSVFGKTSSELALTTSFATGGAAAGGEIAGAMMTAGGAVAAVIGGAMAAGGAGGGALGALGSLANSGNDAATVGGLGDLATHIVGFATGGDVMVGGAGGPDTKLAMFRVTPGESIHVRTPQQREDARKGGSSSGPGHTIVNLNYDPHAIRSGKDIETGVMNVIRRNPAAIRALLGG